MTEDLKNQRPGDGATGQVASALTQKAGETVPNVTPSVDAGATTGGTPPADGGSAGLSPEMTALLEAAVEKVRQEYESPGGHIAKLKSSYDKKIGKLESQIAQGQQAKYQEAMGYLEGGDFESAAQILAGQVQALTGNQQAEQQAQQWTNWIQTVMTDLGADLENDEEDAQFATEWLSRIMQDEHASWDFHQAAAQRQVNKAREHEKAVKDELKKFQDAIPELIKQQATRLLAEAGVLPEASGEGGQPNQADWRELPAGKLIAQGIAARQPIRRQQR